MEKYITFFRLGFKNLYRYKRRYAFLLAAIIFCFGIVSFITSTKDSMYNNLYYTAQSHYAGDIVALGENKTTCITHYLGENDVSIIMSAMELAEINPIHILKRTLFMDTGIVYHNGMSVTQKYIIGCDWENEEFLFSKMDFSSKENILLDDDKIIISAPVANQLNAEMGDLITVEINNNRGQKNTGQFIVSGIIKDSSIFGYYKVYISRLSLNRLIGLNDNDCSILGLFFKNGSNMELMRTRLHKILSQKITTGAIVYDREGMDKESDTSPKWENTKVFLYTLPVYLSEIADLLNAMDILIYLLFGMMLIIILVSASVTYRLILHERTKEVGVMRAIGFFGGDLRTILWTETTILGIISIFGGFLLSMIFSFAASFISFDWFPSFDIFLKNGKLTTLYRSETILYNILLTILVLAAAVVFPSTKASNKNIPSLLKGEDI